MASLDNLFLHSPWHSLHLQCGESGKYNTYLAEAREEVTITNEVSIQLWIKQVALALYMLARLGIIALIFSSFRSLPKEAYTSIEWVTSVPHF